MQELLSLAPQSRPHYRRGLKAFAKRVRSTYRPFTVCVLARLSPLQGIVEGINNRLKVIKRCGFGFTNFANFEKRALLFWHLVDSLA